MKKMQQIIHYPSLKTVLMVEKVLKDAELPISKEEIKRRLPTKVMHQTLNVILIYLEEKGMIILGKKGIQWIYNENPALNKLLENSIQP